MEEAVNLMYDLKDSYGGNEIWILNDEAIHDLAQSYGEMIEIDICIGNSCIFSNQVSMKLILVSQISRGCEITYNGSKHIEYNFSLMFYFWNHY